MNRRRQIFVGGGLLAATIGAVVWWFQTPDPTYEGRPLSVWVNAPLRRSGRFEEALDKRAVPFLIQTLKRRPTKFDERYARVYGRLPKAVQRFIAHPKDYRNRQIWTAIGLKALGHDAIPAIPALIAASHDPPEVHIAVLSALSAIALGTRCESEAIDVLIKATEDPHIVCRQNACYGLGLFTNHVDRVVPVLARALHRGDASGASFLAVVRIGRPAIPALLRAMKEEEGFIRPAEAALERIDPQVAEQAKAQKRADKGLNGGTY